MYATVQKALEERLEMKRRMLEEAKERLKVSENVPKVEQERIMGILDEIREIRAHLEG